MSADLFYSLGLDVTDFKAGARAANEQADEIKKGLRNFKDVIGAGGVGFAVLGFFRAVVTHARESKGAVDENTAAVQRFGAAMEQNKKEALGWGAQFLGTLNRVGEILGLIGRMQIEGGQGFWKSLLSGDVSAALGSYKKAYTDVTREHQRDVELSKEEIRIAAEKQQYAAEDKRLRDEATRLNEQERSYWLANLTSQERVNQLANEYAAINRQLADFQGTALERREKENDLRKTGLALLQANHDLIKENAQKEKESAADAKRAAADREKFLDDQAKKNEEIAKLQLKGTENLTDAEKVQLEILTGKLDKRKAEAEIALLLAKGVENLTDEEKKRLAALTGQTAQITKQLEKVKEQAAVIMSMNVRGFKQFGEAEDDALRDLIAKSNSQIQRNQILLSTSPDSLTTRMDIARLQQEAANAAQELAFRRNFERDLELGGEERARRNFKGDPLQFEEVLQRMTNQWQKQDKTNQLLEKNNLHLQAGFTRLAEQLKASTGRN